MMVTPRGARRVLVKVILSRHRASRYADARHSRARQAGRQVNGTTYAEQAEGPHVKGFPYIRWTIIALFVGAMVINYLTRSILGVAAPAIMAEQHISSGTI